MKQVIYKLLLVLVTVLSISSCVSTLQNNATYSTKKGIFSYSKIDIINNDRFIYDSRYESTRIKTAGTYRINGTNIEFTSDTKPNQVSYITYDQAVTSEGLKIKVVYQDLYGQTQDISAKIQFFYGNGSSKSYKSIEGEYLTLPLVHIDSFRVQWIKTLPFVERLDKLESNKFQIILLENSLGNTNWQNKQFVLRGRRLMEVESPNRVFKKRKKSLQ